MSFSVSTATLERHYGSSRFFCSRDAFPDEKDDEDDEDEREKTG
jgi:hypothetical protein